MKFPHTVLHFLPSSHKYLMRRLNINKSIRFNPFASTETQAQKLDSKTQDQDSEKGTTLINTKNDDLTLKDGSVDESLSRGLNDSHVNQSTPGNDTGKLDSNTSTIEIEKNDSVVTTATPTSPKRNVAHDEVNNDITSKNHPSNQDSSSNISANNAELQSIQTSKDTTSIPVSPIKEDEVNHH